MQGKIKRLVVEKGFGFIEAPGGKDVFFHHASVSGEQFDMLAQGQLVEYTIDDKSSNAKGPRAAGVSPVRAQAA